MKTIKIGKRRFIVMSKNEYEKRRKVEDRVTVNLACAIEYLFRYMRTLKEQEEKGTIDMKLMESTGLKYDIEHVSEFVIEAHKFTDYWYALGLTDSFYRKKLKEML